MITMTVYNNYILINTPTDLTTDASDIKSNIVIHLTLFICRFITKQMSDGKKVDIHKLVTPQK